MERFAQFSESDTLTSKLVIGAPLRQAVQQLVKPRNAPSSNIFNRSFQAAAFVLATFIICSHAASAADGPKLERWRRYAGVHWDVPKDGADLPGSPIP